MFGFIFEACLKINQHDLIFLMADCTAPTAFCWRRSCAWICRLSVAITVEKSIPKGFSSNYILLTHDNFSLHWPANLLRLQLLKLFFQTHFLHFRDFLWNKPIPIIPQTGTCSENRWNGPYWGFSCGTDEEKTFVSGRKLRKLRKTLENCLREWRNFWRFL